jgi:chromosome segregation ATPase
LTKALEEKNIALKQATTTQREVSETDHSSATLDDLQQHVATLESEKNALSKTLEDKTAALAQTISSLEDQMQQAHICHENVLNDKNQQLSELNELLEKAQLASSDNMKSQDAHETEMKDLQALNDQLQQQVSTLESAKNDLNKDLEAKIAAHEQAVLSLEDQIRQAHTASETKDIEFSETREALEWARGKASDTEKILESKDNELSILRDTIANVQTEASSTRKSLHESRASFDGLQKDKNGTEELLAQIQRERMESENALQRRNAEINDLWASLEQSQAGSREALAELQSLRENNTAISGLEYQMKKLRTENEQALRTRDSEIRKLREAVERGELASSNLQQARTAMSDMETQFEEQLAQMEHQVRSKQNEFEDLREIYESSKADYAEMGDLLGATNERLQKSHAEAESLQERQAELTELHSSLEEEATALRNQLDNQLEALEKARDEAEALKASLAESQIEISALQSTQSAGTELEQHIQYVHAEYEETLAAKNAEIEQHRAALEKAQSDTVNFSRTLEDSTAELEDLHRSIDVVTTDGSNKESLEITLNTQISELRAELAATTDEKFELMQKLDELQNQHEDGSATPTSPLDAEKKLQSLRADYDTRVLEFETRHRELVRQQDEAHETHRNELDTLTANHYTELRKRDDTINSLREELDSLKEQLQNLRGVVTAVHSPVINIETSDSESVEERDLEAETTPGALEEGTRFEEFVTPMETQDEQEPQFEDADTTQVSASVDSDGISDDGSYDMDFTHLDSQIGDNDNEPLGSTNTPSTTERKLTVEVPTQTSTNDTSTPSATTTSYSNSALTSQLAHLEAALELSRKETFHSRSALQSQISSLTSELEVTKAEKTSLQQKLANFNAAMDARDEAVFELGGVEDDDVFYTGVAGEDGDGVEGKGKKRKTIEGTLAGLRLQAKQLEELNEEFLSQSLRWSGILPLK